MDGVWLTDDDTTAINPVSAYGNRLMFTAREYDNESGLYYYRARMYHPQLGRFLQPDPLGYFDSMNLHPYLYCSNDPINRTDPSGELWGAVTRARGLAGAINTYGLVLNMGITWSGGPNQMLGSLAIVNAWRENVFSDFFGKGHAQVFAKAGYFGTKKSFIENLFTPDEAWDQPEECKIIDGYFRHCVTSCRVHRYFLGAIPTYLLALYAGGDWPSEDEAPDSASDRRANIQGIINAWKFWDSCYTSCKKSQKIAIEKYCQ